MRRESITTASKKANRSVVDIRNVIANLRGPIVTSRMICRLHRNVTAGECISTLKRIGDVSKGEPGYMGKYVRVRVDGRYFFNYVLCFTWLQLEYFV